MIRSEHVIGFLCFTLEYDNHEGAHEERPIHHLVCLVGGTIVEDQIVTIIFIFKESCQLSSKPMNHGEVQWSKVFIEGKVR